jgi:DNA polymerase-3 subunit gamma/tau
VQAATRALAAAEMVLVRLAYAADLPTPDEALRQMKAEALTSSPALPAGQGPARAPNTTHAAT